MDPSEPKIDVTILMPCLNESKTLSLCITSARAALDELQPLGLTGEILISDNGSTDGSQKIASDLGVRTVTCLEPGYGNALISGARAARGRYIVMGDADASYDFKEAVPMVLKLRDGYDVCLGSRFKGRIAPGAMPWKNRFIGNPLLTGLLNLFYRSGLSDAHCGLRAVTRQAFDRMSLNCPGMEFASEMVVKACLQNLKRAEVPVTLYKDLRGRSPHLKPWSDGKRHVRFLLNLMEPLKQGQLTCPVCESPNPVPAFKKKGYSYHRCRCCGCLFVLPSPAPEFLTAFYGNSDNLLSQICWSGSLDSHRHVLPHWKYALTLANKLHLCGPLLDVACGTGQFLFFAKQQGYQRLTGVEIAPQAAETARRLSGAEIYTRDLIELNLPRHSFACVVLLDFVEHARDVRSLLREVFRLLEPGGTVIIATDHLKGLSMRLLGKNAFNINPPEHLTLFTRKGLLSALRGAGFGIKKEWTASVYLREWTRFIPSLSPVAGDGGKKYMNARSHLTKKRSFLNLVALGDFFLRLSCLGDALYVVAQKPSNAGDAR